LEPTQFVFAPPVQESNPSSNHRAVESNLPVFNMLRLKQIVQNTKHGKMEILRDLRLLIDFKNDPEILVISSNGSNVFIFERSHRLDLESPAATYNRSDLPTKYHKKFRYASRFVELVRSKTPKVINFDQIVYYSPLAKISLMENEPVGDIVASFYTSEKLTFLRSKNELEIKIPTEMLGRYECRKLKEQKDGTFMYTVQMSHGSQVDPVFEQLFQHTERCLKHCLEVEAHPDGDSKYPIIIKSTQSPSKNILPRSQSPPTSLHPSVSTFSTSYQTSKSVTSGAKSRIEDRQPLYTTPKKLPTDLNRSKISLHNSGLASSGSLNNAEFQPKFLENIGWCVQMPDKRFSMLFNDGLQVIMNPKTHSLEYVGESRSE
jgi:polo-like kinase 4